MVHSATQFLVNDLVILGIAVIAIIAFARVTHCRSVSESPL